MLRKLTDKVRPDINTPDRIAGEISCDQGVFMSRAEKLFWVATGICVTLFGTGLLLFFESDHPGWATIFTAGGLIGMASTLYERPAEAGVQRLVVAGIVAMVFTWAFLGYDIYDRHYRSQPTTTAANGVTFVNQAAWDHYALNQVWSKTFANQIVLLDGHEYINCTFNNVTLEYDGTAPARLTTSHFVKGSNVGLGSKNAVVNQTMLIMDGLSKLGVQSPIQCGPLSDMPLLP
jgi:hypothetical protein